MAVSKGGALKSVHGVEPALRGRLSVCSERGAVLALAAVMLPVFLLLSALVVDTGNWFTHKRQLQNRADAGALAAGVEYAASYASCVQDGDATLKTATAAAISGQARMYAGDPGVVGARNTEIADQTKVDVILNSTSYTAGSDESDGGGPCFDHAPDDISPAGGHWIDVKATERDLGSLFASFGLPLARNGARARLEIHPAVSDNGFIPLAVPETEIVKAQVRYYDHCASPPRLLGSTDLKPLKDMYQTVPGTVLWGPDTGGVEVDPSSIPVELPVSSGCAAEYVPIGVEVRVAGRPTVDFTADCATLAASRFGDCWSRLSQIRVWRDTPATVPHFQGVTLEPAGGTSGCSPDAYFARNAVSCAYTATCTSIGSIETTSS